MPPSSELEARKDSLNSKLNASIHKASSRAKSNQITSFMLMIIALLCTVAAAICGIVFDLGKWAGALAIMPTLIAFVASSLKLQGKAQWHYRREGELRTLRSRLKYQLSESPTADQIAAVAKSWDDMEKRMQADWERNLSFDFAALSQRSHVMDQPPESTAMPKLVGPNPK